MKSSPSDNIYDVFYRTKSGRGMIAKNVAVKNATAAIEKIKKEMRTSKSFDKVVTVFKIR